MKVKFLNKNKRVENYVVSTPQTKVVEIKKSTTGVNNKKSKTQEKMDIDQIEALASELTPDQTTKRIKKDKGLIERTESSKIMITEDNKQLLTD